MAITRRPNPHTSFRRKGRSGSVPIEIVMALPLLIVLWMVIFTIAGFTLARSDLANRVRHRAWLGRHSPWAAGQGGHVSRFLGVAVPPTTTTILGPNRRFDPALAVQASDQQTLPVYFEGLNRFRPITSEHWVLGGSWDYQEIAFTERAGHRQLVPTPKVYFFTPLRISFDGFRGLAAFGSLSHLASLSAARTDHASQYALQQQELQQRRTEILATIQAKEQELAQRQRELAALESADPVDQDAVDRVKRDIRQIERQLADARFALDQIGESQAAHPR